MTELSERDFHSFGYLFPRQLPTGEWAGLRRMYATAGLFVGLDDVGYRCRFCYATLGEALLALADWDGAGDDPPGRWIKQKGRGTGGAVDRLNPRLADEDFVA